MKKFTAHLLIVLAAFLLAGCSSFQKQQRKAQAFYNEYPNELAKVCADKFPVTEKVIKGKDSIRRDTVARYITVKCPPNGKDTLLVQVPVTKVITNTILRVDSVVKENTAQVAVMRQQGVELGAKNEQLTKDLSDAENRANKRLFWLIGLAVCLLASLYLNLRSKLF